MKPIFWTSGCGRLCFEMTREDAESGSHQGDCYEDVKALSRVSYIKKQLEVLDPDDIRDYLGGFGAWDAEELADQEMNAIRFLWSVCCDIREEAAL